MGNTVGLRAGGGEGEEDKPQLASVAESERWKKPGSPLLPKGNSGTNGFLEFF
jgi:hypothetical protein